jgi:hypothetical protein
MNGEGESASSGRGGREEEEELGFIGSRRERGRVGQGGHGGAGGSSWMLSMASVTKENNGTEELKILNAVKTKRRAARDLVGVGHGVVGIGLAVCSGVVAWSGRASALRGSSRGWALGAGRVRLRRGRCRAPGRLPGGARSVSVSRVTGEGGRPASWCARETEVLAAGRVCEREAREERE